jgi:hypothetical protein
MFTETQRRPGIPNPLVHKMGLQTLFVKRP